MADQRYFTIKEVAERLQVSHDTVSRLIATGTLPAIRVSARLYRIPSPALARYESGAPVTRRRVVRRRGAVDVPIGSGERIAEVIT